eukprot:m.222974 g.222974  ORF g.222974 m.222974 type:complete len:2105 (+) comp17261_c1_seq2:280-6594(+)
MEQAGPGPEMHLSDPPCQATMLNTTTATCSTPAVSVIIATTPSRATLGRALTSVICQQGLLVNEVIIVVDEPSNIAQLDRQQQASKHVSHIQDRIVPAILAERDSPVAIHVLLNRRTKNVSGTGCWNTGIMAVLERHGCDSNRYIAILDDDDEWHPTHLQSCVHSIYDSKGEVSWVVAGLEWHGRSGISYQTPTAATLSVESFLRGNPGVQGSNLFARLSLLLQAGMFDENMNSMTDRDLCIRILDVLGPSSSRCISFTGSHSVIHHAESDQRVTTDMVAKRKAIVKFLWKYGHRFTAEDMLAFEKRSLDCFSINVQEEIQKASSTIQSLATWNPVTSSGDVISVQETSRRYLGMHADQLNLNTPTGSAGGSRSILIGIVSSDFQRVGPLLLDIARLESNLKPTVMLLVNKGDIEEWRQLVLKIEVPVVLIDPLTTSVQGIAHQYATALNGRPVAQQPQHVSFEIGLARTVLQAHMKCKLDAEDQYSLAMVLDDDKRLPKSFLAESLLNTLKQDTIYLGRDCKTAPNSIAFGVRTQLLDILHTLQRQHAPPLPPKHAIDPSVYATSCAQAPFDTYYDLSTSRFDHLEEPQPIQDTHNLRDRLLRGDPLARDCLPGLSLTTTSQRGGCMLLFRSNFKHLALPQFVPCFRMVDQSISSRRSDSLWLGAVRELGVECLEHPGLFVYHENTNDAILSAHAIRRKALAECMGAILCRQPGSPRKQYLATRVASVISNNFRIRALAEQLEGLEGMSELAKELKVIFDATAWDQEVLAPLQRACRSLGLWKPQMCFSGWDDAAAIPKAVATLATLGLTEPHLSFVGQGKEGVVLRKGDTAYKVFGKLPTTAVDLLCDKAVFDCKVMKADILSYKFVEGTPFEGGYGKQLVELMQRMKASGLTMTNIKPENLALRTDESALEIVDLGRDWQPWTSPLWVSMCKRAFLSWRFAQHCSTPDGRLHVQGLLRRERTESFFPELTGFERFFQLCTNGFSPYIDPDRFEVTQCAFHATPCQCDAAIKASGSKTQATLLITTCLMESSTILANVRSITATLSRSGTEFAETLLVVDKTKRSGLVRQYKQVHLVDFDQAVSDIEGSKLVDRVLVFDGLTPEGMAEARDTNKRIFGIDSVATHSENGEPHVPLLAALESVKTKLVLHVDSDICINLWEKEDLVERANAIFRHDPLAVTTLALPIYFNHPQEGVDGFLDPNGKPFRFEIRFSFLHLPRFRSLLPMKISDAARASSADHLLQLGWFHTFDINLTAHGLRSYRFFSSRGFFVHPPNSLKADSIDYMLLADRFASHDVLSHIDSSNTNPVPAAAVWREQSGHVDAITQDIHRLFGERKEAIIFVCCGRNIPFGRSLRCLQSIAGQRGAESVGVVLVEDAPRTSPAALFEVARQLFPGRISCINPGIHLGTMAVKLHVIRRVCVNPRSIIATLDLDDFLLTQKKGNPSVIESIQSCFQDTSCWVALGGMLLDNKHKRYPLRLMNPRMDPAAGNVWQHLRCFRKFLFDRIPASHFRLSSTGAYVQHGTDWAFMIPIVEQAGPSRVFEFPSDSRFYFYERCRLYSMKEQEVHLDETAKHLRSLPRLSTLDRMPSLVQPVSVFKLPSTYLPAGGARLQTYPRENGIQCLVVIKGSVRGQKSVPVRMHSECCSGDIFGSKRCDCGEQLHGFLATLDACHNGVLVYISGHEGRGNGWDNKSKAYEMSDRNPEAHHDDLLCSLPGCLSDKRDYSEAVDILHNELSILSVVHHSNNPRKQAALEAEFGKGNVQCRSMPATLSAHNSKYLHEKVERLEHSPDLVSGEDQVVEKVAAAFKQLGLDPRALSPSFEALSLITERFLERMPFNSALILVENSDPNICTAGVCYDRNALLRQMLLQTGFGSVEFQGARTETLIQAPEMKLLRARGCTLPLNHIALVVQVAEEEYLVDVGNAAPYYTPLRLDCSGNDVIRHCDLEYRLTCTGTAADKQFVLEHKRVQRADWRPNYTFSQADVLSSQQVAEIAKRHATDLYFGHLIHCLRLSVWRKTGQSVLIKDTTGRVLSPEGECMEEHQLNTPEAMRGFITQHFGDSAWACLVDVTPTLLGCVTLWVESMREPSPALVELKSVLEML